MVKIFVGNLNPESKASDLRKKFEAFGKVTECDVVNNYGFVHMEKESEAEAAIAGLQNAILDGVKINVERSHGKRGGGPGPARRRGEGRYRDYPPERGPRGMPRYMNSGPPPRVGRYGPAWDDGYGGPYAPPPRNSPRGYDYPPNGTNGRYPPLDRGEPHRSMPRGPTRDPLAFPLNTGYRGPPVPEPIPSGREYPSKPARQGYDSYGEFDRYRDPVASVPPRANDYYDTYGNYSSGNYDDYRDNDRTMASYDSGYDYSYYDYGVDSRSPAPPRSGYSYGRP
ncbi:RNA-binding protein 4.1 [Schistosoma japonicum]|uniref:Clone ZZD1343 mRNA sequence n=4 Tax=Schistosoma japonicum TaxID=6182 RepID=Q86EX1_SCHJA|nr:similar to NM_031492 RNA-binding proteinlark in Homo sapiens [Schistosoma japonicum]KAH8854696.1 RNA-binding protein 4.1 [Schistosoma japonicum]CAX76054.1 RNA-binding protein 4 [Schistosoma japonicum]CAX76055.1 RNA-binding protein 4 [Schistosoma japonicum]CAX76056.1 RNA-binding protein 4 [Schistosoma japonicum]